MTDKEKFLAGHRFVFANNEQGGAMVYKEPNGNHPFGSIFSAGVLYQIAICETNSITDKGFYVWGFWMNKHQSREVLFSELKFWGPRI